MAVAGDGSNLGEVVPFQTSFSILLSFTFLKSTKQSISQDCRDLCCLVSAETIDFALFIGAWISKMFSHVAYILLGAITQKHDLY